jgi:hypothetical protein
MAIARARRGTRRAWAAGCAADAAGEGRLGVERNALQRNIIMI